MKGVKKENEKRKLERDNFVRELFVEDTETRIKAQFKTDDDFYLEPLSGPKAQALFKKRFKVPMNSQRLFDLRREIWAQFNLDKNGRPTTKTTILEGVPTLQPQGGQALTSANRDPNDPLFHVALIKIEDEAQGLFLKGALDQLRDKGFVEKELRVDGIHSQYASISRWPETKKDDTKQ